MAAILVATFDFMFFLRLRVRRNIICYYFLMHDDGWCNISTKLKQVLVRRLLALYSHVIIAEESYKVSVNNLLRKMVKRKIKSP